MTRFRLLPALLLGVLVVAVSGCASGNLGEMVLSGPGGLCGLLLLIADIWAIVQVANSSADSGSKLLWAALIFFFPVGGLALWYFFGPKS